MGHTHRQIVKRLPGPPPTEKLYVNCGTWIPLWPLDREDLRGRIVYSFIRFQRQADGEYRPDALEWDDHARDPLPARMLPI